MSLFEGISSYDAPLVSGNSFGGSGFGGSGGSFGGGAGVQQGQSQVIDISGGGSASSIVYKPVIREGPPQISKSFYVHEAPDDAVNVEVREKEIQVRPQKHYKIIFIKAPSGGSSAIGGNAAIFPQVKQHFYFQKPFSTADFLHRAKRRQLSTSCRRNQREQSETMANSHNHQHQSPANQKFSSSSTRPNRKPKAPSQTFNVSLKLLSSFKALSKD